MALGRLGGGAPAGFFLGCHTLIVNVNGIEGWSYLSDAAEIRTACTKMAWTLCVHSANGYGTQGP